MGVGAVKVAAPLEFFWMLPANKTCFYWPDLGSGNSSSLS